MIGDDVLILPLDPDEHGPGVVELIRELVPYAVITLESWRHRQTSTPARARYAAWVATVGGHVVGHASAGFNWTSESRTAIAGVAVHESFRKNGIGTRLWNVVETHVDDLAPTRVLAMFVETPEGVEFARARGFVATRVETLACVDPRIVDTSRIIERPSETNVVQLRDVPAEQVYEVELASTPDMPSTDQFTEMTLDEWLSSVWRRPLLTLDGSFAAVDDGRVVCFTMLSADHEIGRAYNDYTGTLPSHRGRGLATQVKLASLEWAAANGITSVWTMNDETNVPMLAVNKRLGYRTTARRVEYVRG